MSNKLNLFSKMRLSLRARRDVRLDLFRNFDYATSDPDQADCFVISNFIFYDLGQYENDRAHLHTGKRFLFWTPMHRPYLRHYHLMPLSNAIPLLNGAISRIQSQIHLVYAEYNKTMDVLQEQTDRYAADNAPHYVHACFNKSVEARTTFQRETKNLYSQAVILLNQKIQLLSKLQSRAESIRSKHFHRIRFYYERASALEPKLPVQYFGEDRFAMVADVSTISFEYVQELHDARALLAQMTAEIDQLFP